MNSFIHMLQNIISDFNVIQAFHCLERPFVFYIAEEK